MKSANTLPNLTRTVRFHSYGEPEEVLRFEETTVQAPAANQVLVEVRACALNPADWALCKGLFAGKLPRGVGLEVAGMISRVGYGVANTAPGEMVFGPVDFVQYASAGAADMAILQHWTPVPEGLSAVHAAALPMAIAVASGSLDCLEVTSGKTVLIHGAGSTVGYAAVQIALLRGARVVATAGNTFAENLRALGASVTAYGEGMIGRVKGILGTAPDCILDTAPVSGALRSLVEIAGDSKRVMTISDFAAAKELGARSNLEEPRMSMRYDVLGDFALLAARGEFSIPIAGTFALEDWREAMTISRSHQARGKLILVP